MCRQIILALFFLLALQATAQEPVYRRFTGKHGLPSAEVYDVQQDNEGYLWFATDQGLARFDGYHFDVFDQESGLPELTVFDIVKDPFGRIWVNTYQGHFAWFDGKKMQAYAFNDKLDSLYRTFFGTSTIIKTYSVDSAGNLSFNLQSKGRYQVDSRGNIRFMKKKELYPYFELLYTEEGTLQQSIPIQATALQFLFEKDHMVIPFTLPEFPEKPARQQYTALYQNNTLIVAVNQMVYQIGMDGRILQSRRFLKTILCLKVTADNKLWIGTAGDGVFAFKNMDLNQIEGHFLLNHSVSSIGFDHENGMWVTSLSRGVYHIPLLDAKAYSSYKGKDFTAIGKLEQINDSLLGVCLSGNRMATIDNHDSIRFFDFPELTNDIINNMLTDSLHDRLLLSTINGLYEIRNRVIEKIVYREARNPQKGKETFFGIKDMAIDPQTGNLWMGGFGGLWCLSPDNEIIFNSSGDLGFNKRIESVAIDSKKRVYMAALDGLYVYNSDSIEQLGKRFPLLNSRITCLKSINDTIWIGTKGAGLCMLANDSLLRFTMANGLASNSILSLHMGQDELFIGTNQGMTMLDRNLKAPLQMHTIDAKNGLFSNEIRTIAQFNHKVILGSPEGLHVYLSTALEQPHNIIPVYITNILVNNQPTDLSAHIELPYSKNNFQIDFFAISYRNQGKQLYRHRLSGLEADWIVNQKTTAQYPYLPAGRYFFEVEVMNSDGTWNPASASFSIEILQPYWKSIWFIIIVLLLASAIITLLFQWRIHVVKQHNQLIHDINWFRQEALINQMNPHFLFNALNTVQRYILENDKLSSSRYLSKFAVLMRKVLDNSQEKEITVTQEVEALQLYLELEAARFKDKFVFSINIDETLDADHVKIPVFIVQPLVENAIWHGMMHSSKPGELSISFERFEADGLKITVTDNGIGRKEAARLKSGSKKRSLGTNIISKRISLINTQEGTNIRLVYVDLNETNDEAGGTKVFVIFPNHLQKHSAWNP